MTKQVIQTLLKCLSQKRALCLLGHSVLKEVTTRVGAFESMECTKELTHQTPLIQWAYSSPTYHVKQQDISQYATTINAWSQLVIALYKLERFSQYIAVVF